MSTSLTQNDGHSSFWTVTPRNGHEKSSLIDPIQQIPDDIRSDRTSCVMISIMGMIHLIRLDNPQYYLRKFRDVSEWCSHGGVTVMQVYVTWMPTSTGPLRLWAGSDHQVVDQGLVDISQQPEMVLKPSSPLLSISPSLVVFRSQFLR